MDKLTVNDGKGLYDNEGICDVGIQTLNTAMRNLVSGQYIAFCDGMKQAAQIFQNLKTGIKKDRESLERQIADLEAIVNRTERKEG